MATLFCIKCGKDTERTPPRRSRKTGDCKSCALAYRSRPEVLAATKLRNAKRKESYIKKRIAPITVDGEALHYCPRCDTHTSRDVPQYECTEFLAIKAEQRERDNKKPLAEMHEHRYQLTLFHIITNLGVACRMEVKSPDRSVRYDLYMPELELIVELKIKSSAWTTARVERQIAEQQATKTDWLVIGSAPNGEYGLFDMDDTIGIINGLQLQALQQGLAT